MAEQKNKAEAQAKPKEEVELQDRIQDLEVELGARNAQMQDATKKVTRMQFEPMALVRA